MRIPWTVTEYDTKVRSQVLWHRLSWEGKMLPEPCCQTRSNGSEEATLINICTPYSVRRCVR